MKKIWKTWKPRKKESRGTKNCTSLTPQEMKYKVLVYVPTEAAPPTALYRAAQPPRTPTYSIS